MFLYFFFFEIRINEWKELDWYTNVHFLFRNVDQVIFKFVSRLPDACWVGCHNTSYVCLWFCKLVSYTVTISYNIFIIVYFPFSQQIFKFFFFDTSSQHNVNVPHKKWMSLIDLIYEFYKRNFTTFIVCY